MSAEAGDLRSGEAICESSSNRSFWDQFCFAVCVNGMLLAHVSTVLMKCAAQSH